jgi:sterol desaturase/sphingolipid hydroxylase (fatty acid hydroxylase superfamily)
MIDPHFLTNVAVVLGLMTAISLIELMGPLFARNEASRGRGIANLGMMTLTIVLNAGLTALAAVVALAASMSERGLLAWFTLPRWAMIALGVAVLDLSTYVAHLTMHKSPLLWRAHRVHHSDPFVDVTTTLRQHPLEGLWRFLWTIIPVWVLGLPAAGVVVYRLLSTMNALFEHANIRMWRPLDSALSLLISTPNMHKIHHSRHQVQTDTNYGNILAVYDRLFRTFTPTRQAFDVVFGLEDIDPARIKSLPGLLTMPFRAASKSAKAREPWPSDPTSSFHGSSPRCERSRALFAATASRSSSTSRSRGHLATSSIEKG